jgi:hypothetical protein
MNFTHEHLTDTHPTLDHILDSTHLNPDMAQPDVAQSTSPDVKNDFDALIAHAIANPPVTGKRPFPWFDFSLLAIVMAGATWYTLSIYSNLTR